MKKERNKIIDYITYLAVRWAAMILHIFPIDANLRTARILGSGMWYVISRNTPFFNKLFKRKHYDQMMEHLRIAFGSDADTKELEKIAKASCESLVMFTMEFLFTSRIISRSNWQKYFKLINFEPALKILLENKGAIMLTGHYGNFELPGYLMATLGFDMVAVMRPLDNPYLNDYIVKAREHHGLKLLYKKGASTSMEQVLGQGSILSFIADQDAGRKGVFVEFFGKKASTYRSIPLVARELNVPIIIGGSRRTCWDKFQHEIELEDIIYPEDWKGQDNEVEYITRRFNESLERMIRKDPRQYLWLHRRWKSLPPEERKKKEKMEKSVVAEEKHFNISQNQDGKKVF